MIFLCSDWWARKVRKNSLYLHGVSSSLSSLFFPTSISHFKEIPDTLTEGHFYVRLYWEELAIQTKKRKRGRNANVTILLMISTLKSLINPVTEPETGPGDSVPGFNKIVPSFNKELCHRWQWVRGSKIWTTCSLFLYDGLHLTPVASILKYTYKHYIEYSHCLSHNLFTI